MRARWDPARGNFEFDLRARPAARELLADEHAVATLHLIPGIGQLGEHREVRSVGLMGDHPDDLPVSRQA
jgi:hypothetical protein